MRAVVQRAYGRPAEVLAVRDVPRPAPGAGEVLVRVRAASLHPDVWHVVTGQPYLLRLMGAGARRPAQAVPGTDLAGAVEAVGPGVTRFKPGDEVFGETMREMAWKNGGAFAEYAVAPEEALAPKPANVTFEQAAAVPSAGYIAIFNLRAACALRPGMRVLVNGAAGGVGSLALQIAKAAGAHVTGVDHPSKLDLVRSLGADAAVDYTRDDVTRGAERYDLVFDVASTLDFAAVKRILAPGGKYVLIGHDHFGHGANRVFGSLPRMLGLSLRSLFDPHAPRPTTAMPEKRAVIGELAALLAAGKLTPAIDSTYPLEAAAEAFARMMSGEGRGKVLLTP